ncbi:hypothetical protein J3R30DRAFT_1517591 [Lentinula aciculospora]|uniref:Uncharacterized protein n=1 Tax=Lentinula aciculospora TaxID=153920 RepID=A0A9W8ZXV3_9AGAR|nr:hypothetical protein J3R30DRAFT_1517591 [Lentinula aciculospora]
MIISEPDSEILSGSHAGYKANDPKTDFLCLFLSIHPPCLYRNNKQCWSLIFSCVFSFQMILKELTMLFGILVLSMTTASPIRATRQLSDPSNAPNETVDAFAFVDNDTTSSSNRTLSLPIQNSKRAPTLTLYVSGCTSVLNKSPNNPSVVKKHGPFHLSPEGGLYLTNRLENAKAMARLEFTNCQPVTSSGFISKWMISSYEFDDTGLSVMDLDSLHWQQDHAAVPHLPTWWNYQTFNVIPRTGVNSLNRELYQKYLSAHVVIG